MSTIGSTLVQLRSTALMSVSEAADAAGTAPAYLARVEAGEASPSPAWIQHLAAAITARINN